MCYVYKKKKCSRFDMMGLRLHLCFLALFSTFLISIHGLGPLCLPEEHVALFTFGDSEPVWYMYLKTENCCLKIFMEIRVGEKVY